MTDYLIISMWFQISIKLKRTVEQSKIVICNMHYRFENDKDFDFLQHHADLRDAFNFYLDSKKTLGFD